VGFVGCAGCVGLVGSAVREADVTDIRGLIEASGVVDMLLLLQAAGGGALYAYVTVAYETVG
jgi:hypothetical protein